MKYSRFEAHIKYKLKDSINYEVSRTSKIHQKKSKLIDFEALLTIVNDEDYKE